LVTYYHHPHHHYSNRKGGGGDKTIQIRNASSAGKQDKVRDFTPPGTTKSIPASLLQKANNGKTYRKDVFMRLLQDFKKTRTKDFI